jgi:HD superfamily phosphodiesterase
MWMEEGRSLNLVHPLATSSESCLASSWFLRRNRKISGLILVIQASGTSSEPYLIPVLAEPKKLVQALDTLRTIKSFPSPKAVNKNFSPATGRKLKRSKFRPRRSIRRPGYKTFRCKHLSSTIWIGTTTDVSGGMNPKSIAGIQIPESKLANAARELVRDTESPLLYNHSTRVFYFGALAGQRQKLKFDSELLYLGAMFHDMGLTKQYRSATERFEVDSANAAREFLRQHGIDEASIEVVWDAIALHTTPGIPQHKKPEVALVTAGVETDVLGIGYHDLADGEREAVVAAHPREEHFKEEIIRAFHDGFCDKPDTTFGTVNDDVLALLDPRFKRANFCSIILGSPWRG